MPGPESSNVILNPLRLPLFSTSSVAEPPPPYTTVLRQISLAAVTILVWSTRLNPASTARRRTVWRTFTISTVDRKGITSDRTGAIVSPCGRRRLDQRHSSFHVEGCAYTSQREAQFYQRYGHGRPHPHYYRRRPQKFRYRRDVR